MPLTETLPTNAGIDALDELLFRDFLRGKYGQKFPNEPVKRLQLLRNMQLATEEGLLNLAGLLLFAELPTLYQPQLVIRAKSCLWADVDTATYEPAEDFRGPLRRVFNDAFAFVMRHLHKVQAGQSVNSLGIPEIPPVVLQELLVNALVHRDYRIDAPIRLLVFRNRIEITSPGCLPNNLSVKKICASSSISRNPILASYAAKGVLPYRGKGSGVPRVIESWPKIDFRNDRKDRFFTTVVYRDRTVVSGEPR